jgi:hypothetical protein
MGINLIGIGKEKIRKYLVLSKIKPFPFVKVEHLSEQSFLKFLDDLK